MIWRRSKRPEQRSSAKQQSVRNPTAFQQPSNSLLRQVWRLLQHWASMSCRSSRPLRVMLRRIQRSFSHWLAYVTRSVWKLRVWRSSARYTMFLLNCPKQDRKHDDSLAKHGIEHEDSFPLLTVVFPLFSVGESRPPSAPALGLRPSINAPSGSVREFRVDRADPQWAIHSKNSKVVYAVYAIFIWIFSSNDSLGFRWI